MDRDLCRPGGSALVVVAVGALWFCAASAKPPPAPPQFEQVVIEAPLGGLADNAMDINNRGQVAGTFFNTTTRLFSAFIWTEKGGLVELGVAMPGGGSSAQAINECGEVAGYADVPDPAHTSPVRWRSPGELEVIADVNGAAAGINERGHIVGNFLTAANQIHAFLWTPEEGIVDLGTLGGVDDASFAYAINNRDEVVGTSFLPSGQHAFLWTRRAGMRDLGALDNESSEAHGINDARQVAGFTHIPLQVGSRAFLWTVRTGMVALEAPDQGPPDHLAQGSGSNINQRGDVVGYAGFPESGSRAALWPRRGSLVQVDFDPDIGFSVANAVNDRGDIVGQQDATSFQRAVLWRAVDSLRRPQHHENKLCRKRHDAGD